MAKVEYSKEFLQISSQLKLSEEEKKKGWTGAVDGTGEQKQVLVFEKAGKFFALTNSGAKPLEGVKDIDSAKTLAKQNITGKPDFGGLNFSDEALAAMSKTREGGGGSETAPAGADVKPAVAGAAADPVAAQAAKLQAIAKEYPQGGAEAREIKDKNGKPTVIVLGTKDGGKTYEARDLNGKTLPLATPKDLKNILIENKTTLENAIIKDDFGLADNVVSGAVEQPNVNTAGVQQGASSPEAPAGAPPVVTPASMPGRAANGAANYTETGAGAPTETTLPAEGGTPPAATPVTGQPASTGA
jgi:hypothetical protein